MPWSSMLLAGKFLIFSHHWLQITATCSMQLTALQKMMITIATMLMMISHFFGAFALSLCILLTEAGRGGRVPP